MPVDTVRKQADEPSPQLTAKISADKLRPAIARKPVVPKFFGHVSAQERINFARQLSIAVKSGMPLVEGLQMIRAQASSKRMRRIIDQLVRDVNNGQFLAQGLERNSRIFGHFFINMVKVGEASGNLAPSLLYLAEELRKQREVAHKVRGALVYPVIILIGTVAITLFLTFFIFPKILPIFESLQVELPLTTRMMIAGLDFLRNHGVAFAVWVVAALIGLRLLLVSKMFRYYFDRLLLSVPVVSRVIQNTTMTNLSRSLAVLLRSGMTLMDALSVSTGTFHSSYYRRHIDRVIEGVRRGESVANYMMKYPKFFPPMFAGMIHVGETTGNLEENLRYLSEFYEGEVDDTIRNLTTIIEPVMLLFMGAIVGFVALSIITPIYKVTQGIKI